MVIGWISPLMKGFYVNPVSSPVTVEELKALPELFYCSRDARTNLRVVVSPDLVPISIVVSDRSAESVNGQMILLTLLNTLIRTGRRFSGVVVQIPEVPLLLSVGGLQSSTLRNAISELANKVDPHNKIRFGANDFGLAIAIGEKTTSACQIVAAGVSEKGARLSSVPFESIQLSHPIAAVIAANSAVAEVYKHYTPFVRADAFKEFEQTIPRLTPISVGSALLVGAGGISHALAWVLQWLNWTGRLTVLDFDMIDASNLNRYFCAFIDDVGAHKPELLSEFLRKATSIAVDHQTGTYEQLRDNKRLDPASYSSILTAVDNVLTRLEVQSDLPRLVVNSGTNSWSFDASRHNIKDSACLGCLFPPLQGVNFGRRVRCDERLVPAEQPPTESYSFVTGMAGAYFALQIAAGCDQQLSVLPTRYHGSGLNLDSIITENRQKDPQCTVFCSEPSVLERFDQKYAAQRYAATR
jgi:molybdopterin/thiamine biosynthesis adenylyltransferase